MGDVEVLHRPLFTEAEAARLLRVPQSTLHWWLEGGTRRGVSYPPVLRTTATGQREVTWGEFVEAGADFDEVAGLFDLSREDVEWAWAYERKQSGVRAA